MDPATAVHLYNLSLFDPVNPISTVHAVASDTYAYKNGINLPPGINHCDECGVLHIPGLTSTCRVKYTKKSKSSFRTRGFQVTCLVCHHKTTTKGLLDKKRVSEAPTTVSRGDKKKKKKRSDLASLLAAKKQQDAQKPLSLFEFMQ